MIAPTIVQKAMTVQTGLNARTLKITAEVNIPTRPPHAGAVKTEWVTHEREGVPLCETCPRWSIMKLTETESQTAIKSESASRLRINVRTRSERPMENR
jgi:hypothetical protein